METIISASNIYMKYKNKDKDFTLKNVSFNVAKGEFHAFIGENGAGKSTAIKIISGLNNDFDGNLLVNGLNVKTDVKARAKLCYIPDKTSFPLNISAYDFLYQLALLVREDKEQIKIELNDWIKKLNLEEDISRNPNKLSSGQVKKILLIRAALEQSEIIILDEPAAFLDPTSRLQFFELLKDLNNKGVTIFISSHILDEIKKYINSVTFIKKGEIKWSGKIAGKDLIEKYKEIIINVEV